MKRSAVVKVGLIKLVPGGVPLQTLSVALPADVTHAAVACLRAE